MNIGAWRRAWTAAANGRRRTAPVLAIAAAAFFSAEAVAQEPALTVHVEAGIGDTIRTGAPAPVRVRLSNRGATNYEGRVGAAFEGILRQTPDLWVWTDVQMPAGSEKLIHLTLPPGDTPQAVVARYEDENGRRIGEMTGRVKAVSAAAPCLLAVGTAPRSLPGVLGGEDAGYTVLTLAPELAPPSHEGLAMFDAIVLAPPPYEPLSRAQITALSDWVRRGGVLAIDASQRTEFFRSEGLDALSPYMPSSALQGDLGLFEEALRYTTGTVNGGEAVWAAGDTPLLLRKPMGLGAVAVYTVDTDSPAFLKLPEATRTWTSIFAFASGAPPAQQADFGAAMRDALIRSMESGPRSTVRLGAVVVLTLLYALVVGPGDYFLIRWLRRPRLTWLTFPAIVIVFTAVAYFGAKAYIGGDLETQSRVRLLAFLDEGAAIRQTVSSVFVPAADEYLIAADGAATLAPLQQSLAAGEHGLDVFPDESAIRHEIPVWTQRFYTTDEAAEPPPVGFAVSVEDGRVIAELRNDSPYELRDNVFAMGRYHAEVPGAVAPGETRRFDIAPEEEVRRDGLSVIPAEHDDGLRFTADFFADRLGHYRSAVEGAVGPMRVFNLRPALDRGAAVWLCRAPTPAAESVLTVDGEPGAAPGSMELHLVTYEGAQL